MKVFAIVVTYNGMKWIEECLNSILNSSIPVEIIVIDNCSSDETVVYLKSNFKKIILFEHKENLGFGKANNIGMSYALIQNANFVFLLNQDAFVEKFTIEKLIEASLKYPDYGIISPIHLDYSGKLLEHYFYKFMANNATRSFYSDFVLSNRIKKVYDVPFIQAASWLLPIKTLKTIGGFDPVFFHYGEDDNYCHRVLYHNMKIAVVSDVFIRHDSNIDPKPILSLFSNSYFSNYEKQLYVKYGNLNYDFSIEHLENEKNEIYKLMINGFLCFDFFKIKGAFKMISILKQCIKQVIISRNKNIIVGANYIN